MSSFESITLAKDILENNGKVERQQLYSLLEYYTPYGQRNFKMCIDLTTHTEALTSPFVRRVSVLYTKHTGITQDGKKFLEENKAKEL